jgi:hypothetical protein
MRRGIFNKEMVSGLSRTKKPVKKLIIFLALTISTNSYAGLLIEPYVGYNAGTIEQKNNSDQDGKLAGSGYGARLGYSFLVVFAALDFRKAVLSDNIKESGEEDRDANQTELGVTAGIWLPFGLRFWGGYQFVDRMKLKDDTNGTNNLKGSGMKAGIGYKLPIIPLSFNAEYIMSVYNKKDGESLSDKYNSSLLFVSVSMPLDL